MSVDKTLGRFAQRYSNRPGVVPPAGKQQQSVVRQSQKPERSRQSLHIANQAMKDLDEAYRQAEHSVFPKRLNKANFVEAMFQYGIDHTDEVIELALERQAQEEGE